MLNTLRPLLSRWFSPAPASTTKTCSNAPATHLRLATEQRRVSDLLKTRRSHSRSGHYLAAARLRVVNIGLRRLPALNLPSWPSPVGRVSTRHPPISHPVGLKPDLQNQTMGRFITRNRLSLCNGLIGYWIAEFELKGADRATTGNKLFRTCRKPARSLSAPPYPHRRESRRQRFGKRTLDTRWRGNDEVFCSGGATSLSHSGQRQRTLHPMFYRATPQIVRTVSAQSAESDAITAEKRTARLSYSHLEELVNPANQLLDDPAAYEAVGRAHNSDGDEKINEPSFKRVEFDTLRDEAGLNMALYGHTAKQWREENPGKTGNFRDYSAVEQLIVLTNLESINAELIRQGINQPDSSL